MRLRYSLLALVLFFCAQSASGQWSFVAGGIGCTASAGASCGLAIGTANTADFIFVQTWDDIGAPTAMSDGGDTFTQVSCTGARSNITFWYAPNVTSGSKTVTVTRPAGLTDGGVVATIWRGIATSSPLDAFDCTSLANTALGTVSATASAANELVIGAYMGGGCTTITIGAGYTSRETDSCIFVTSAVLQQSKLSASGSNSSTASGGGGNYSQAIFIFKLGAATPVRHKVVQN
jgi:hypothetical protein